jgi:hypothetical protein
MAEERQGDHRCHKHVPLLDRGGHVNESDQPEPVITPEEA